MLDELKVVSCVFIKICIIECRNILCAVIRERRRKKEIKLSGKLKVCV